MSIWQLSNLKLNLFELNSKSNGRNQASIRPQGRVGRPAPY
jgi:hypothetical protein